MGLCRVLYSQPCRRLHFNGKQKYLGLFDENKKETRHPVDGVDGLYGFAEALRDGAGRMEGALG